LLAAAWQSATLEWWQTQRKRFELFTSQLVLDEAAAGHPDAADRRLLSLKNIPILPLTEAATDLAELFINEGALPHKASDDALHLALAAYHNVDYLLTCELPSSRQCRDETGDAWCVRRSWVHLSRNMHTT